MPVRTAERLQFLHDVMITAISGGVSYWSVADDIVRHENDDLFYVSYVLYCSDGGKEPIECGNDVDEVCKGHTVDPELVARGLGLGTKPEAASGEIGWAYSQRKHVILANRESDAGEIDSVDADCIVQLGIFGKVVYG